MKPNEIRNLSTEEIMDEVAERRKKIQELRFTSVLGQTSDTKEIRRKRREIARLLTVAKEMETA